MFEDNTAVVIGVAAFVSEQEGCGAKGYPGAFTYVPNYIEWIKPLMS